MAGNTEVSLDTIRGFAEAFQSDPMKRLAMNAVVKNGLSNTAENYMSNVNMQHTFSIQIETGKVTNQKSSGRCWLFAGLNALRLEIIRKCNLEHFELSQNYPMFWDKFEKANYFLESILETLDEPVGSRLLDHLLASPVQDGGQWDMFAALVEKYGVAPQSQMPETFHSSNTGVMNKYLTLKLREFAVTLRGAYASGKTREQLAGQKTDMLQTIYRMLCICLGNPPTSFDFEYRDKDKKFHREADLTPLSFYEKYIGKVLDDYVSLINAPTADKPYYKTFTVQYLGNVKGGREVKYLNLPSGELKALAIAQLSDDQPVWFGCDVGQWLSRENGAMDLNGFNYENVLFTKFPLTKAERLDYRESMLTHAMVFLGVNLVGGKPNRWKVENSWGDKAGKEGWFIMSDDWFDEYNYQIVVNKKYLNDKQRAALELAPIMLKPWDPMGSLALMF